MKTVGYVCSFIGSEAACGTQMAMIERYCQQHDITCDKFFCDLQEHKRTNENAETMRAVGYEHAYRSERYFAAYDQMLCEISKGNIKKILVDTLGRLKACRYISEFFELLCTHHKVEVVEVCGHLGGQWETEFPKVALYRFTDKSDKRPRVYTKSIDAMYEFVSQQKCWGTPFLYQDYSLKKSEHKEYEKFKNNAAAYGTLLTTDFYHIDDKLCTFFKEISELRDMGVVVESMKEGVVKRTADDFLKKNLKVAIYDCWLDNSDKALELERLKVFVKYKTSWKIANIFVEDGKVEKDGEQKQLQNLKANASNYDAILVRRFNTFHWRTSMFFKIMKQLNVPVFSMKEGGIYLEKPRS